MSTTTLEKTDRDSFDGIRELFCRECGYGIVVRRELPDCPMCRAQQWQDRPGFRSLELRTPSPRNRTAALES